MARQHAKWWCLVFLLVVNVVWAAFGNEEKCPNTPQCFCKWSGGKKMADCSNAGLNSVPTTLSPEIQILIMDGNSLTGLAKDAFKSVGLVNLQRLSLRSCDLRSLDENAFRDLKILIELDVSKNNLTKLKPKTFDGNDGLQAIRLAHNPLSELVAYQFPPLRNLKTIDVSHCELDKIDEQAFQNLGGSVETVLLNNNRLKSLKVDSFIALHSLRTLQLHHNPWVCDCKLKSFRDWLVHKKLYTRQTDCNEPARLHAKTWDDVMPGDFACKPILYLPYPFVFGAPGMNVTLPCHITGSPKPQARWVLNGRIINNNTSPAPFSDQKWLIHDASVLPHDNIYFWYNLTISNVGYDNLGEYLCVAENNGGVMEKGVTLTFDDPSTWSHAGQGAGPKGLSTRQWTIIIGATAAAILFIGLMILICCCFVCKKKRLVKDKSKVVAANSDTASIQALGRSHSDCIGHGECEALLLHHQQQQQQQQHHHHLHHLHQPHHVIYNGYEVGMGANSSTSGASVEGASTPEPQQFIPDLLDTSQTMRLQRKTSTPLSAVQLMTLPLHHQHLLGQQASSCSNRASPISVASTSASPFPRSGTLPLPHSHRGSGRSVSCDHSCSSAGTLKPCYHHPQPQARPNVMAVHYHHPLSQTNLMAPVVIQQQQQQQQLLPQSKVSHSRPAYVTLPRKTRSSWSAPPPPSGSLSGHRDSSSPLSLPYATLGAKGSIKGLKGSEPIYDGVGPRTSADGSSRASLNHSTTLPRNQHLNKSFDNSVSPGGRGFLLPYCAPIAELQEAPATPKERPKSTPNILDLSREEEESLMRATGAKGEPLTHDTSASHQHNDSSMATSSSDMTLMEENISSYCEPFGTAVKPNESSSCQSDSGNRVSSSSNSSISNSNRHSVCSSSGDMEHNNNLDGVALSNGNGGPKVNGKEALVATIKKVPPKTLPKPRVRPVPPPKPKQTGPWCLGVTSFQDESADGSEV